MMNEEGRKILLEDLKRGVIEVQFTKVDGTPRTMRCTLMPQLLPENHNEREEHEFHTKNPDVVAVWDTQKKGWRSFRLDSVEYTQFLDTY
jgi:hypothetical protein